MAVPWLSLVVCGHLDSLVCFTLCALIGLLLETALSHIDIHGRCLISLYLDQLID